MSDTVISIENVSKLYRLGQVGTGTLSHDLNRWWHRVRGKEDPYAKVGQTNDRSRKGGSENGYAWALRDVNLKVNQGEILGIIGRNGAGKSTLLKIMSRVTSPTTGHVRIKGRIAALLEVGTGFHPELTGRENIYLNGAILGMRRHEISRKLNEIVDFSGCAAYMDTPVKRYSSGMFVRLAFAVAAHLDPEILVVDEVLAVGDSEFQKRCLAKMDEVSHSQGRTILFVSHQLGVVSALCKTGLLLKDGEVALAGDISSVLQAYLSHSNQSSGEVTWEPDKAPQSPHVRLTRLRVTSEGKVCDCVPISQEVQLELEYEVLAAGPIFNVSFHLLDPMGNCILATANLASASHTPDKLSGTKLPPGRYLSQCVIPSHFLNDTSYKVSAFVVTNFAHIEVQAVECVGFAGHDDGSMRQEFSGAWIGQIRPRLDWRTERFS